MLSNRHVMVALFVALSVSFTAPAISQASSGDATVQNVTYAGSSAIELDSNGTHIWRNGTHSITVSVETDSGFDDADLCLYARSPNATTDFELACGTITASANSTTSTTIDVGTWPSNLTGRQTVRAVVYAPADGTELDAKSLELTVLRNGGDLDDDGLANEREVPLGTDLRRNDTDEDGLDDGIEVHAYGTDPLTNDTDGDGLDDAAEVQTHQTDPAVADTDGDGLTDDWEVQNDTSPNVADTDGDGLDDALEVNTYETNATVPDSDGDGLDDGAEVREHGTSPTKQDTDGDGLPDNLEVHTYETDPSAIDTDGDGLQDGSEVNEHRTDPTATDTDGDGLSDGAEVNTHGTNPTRADTDGDGLDDAAEVNRYETDPLSSDTDGDGVSDAQEVDRSQFAAPSLVWALGAAGVLVALAVVVGVYRTDGSLLEYVRGRVPNPTGSPSAGDGRPATEAETADGAVDDESGPDQGRTALATGAPGSEGNGDAGDVMTANPDAENTAGGADAVDPDELDLELLPNPECVLTLLDANDGQIRQTELVEETGWSKAKVSRVLSQMESDDQIVKVSIGRGNLITRPNDVPSGARSPFED